MKSQHIYNFHKNGIKYAYLAILSILTGGADIKIANITFLYI